MKASCSMFGQILKLIPRIEFERVVRETGAGYRSKGLSHRPWPMFEKVFYGLFEKVALKAHRKPSVQ